MVVYALTTSILPTVVLVSVLISIIFVSLLPAVWEFVCACLCEAISQRGCI